MAGVGALLSAVAVGSALVGPTSEGSDFAAFWRGARWLTGGRVGSLYPLASFGGLQPPVSDGTFKGFLNPPHTAALFAPFSALGLRPASLLFAGVNMALLIGLGVFAWQILRRSGFARLTRTTALLLLLGCPAVAISVVNGTMSLVILAAMIWLIAADRDGDAWASGLPLALVAWKPQYAVLPVVYLLARRHVRAVLGGGVLTAISMAAALPFTGIRPWLEYLPFLNRYAETLDIWDLSDPRQLWLPRQMVNVRGLLVRALGSDEVSLINMISALTVVLGVAIVIVIAVRVRTDVHPLAGWSAVIALTVATSQHTNVSDGVLLLIPAVLLVQGWARGTTPRPAVVLWWLAALDVSMMLGNPSGSAPPVPWSALTALALTIAVTAPLLNRRGRRADAETVKTAAVTPVAPVTTAVATAPSVRVARSAGDRATLDSFLLGTLAIAMTVMPYVIVGRGRDAWQMSASLSFADLIAALLAVVNAGPFVARLRRRDVHRLIWGGLGVVGALAVTALIHPSPRGAVLVVRCLVGVVLADLLVRTDARRREVLVRWLGYAVLFQCAVAVAQRVTRGAVGLAFLGEPLYPFRAGYPVPAGTMRDAYPLAAFALFVAALHAVAMAQGWRPRQGRLSSAVIVAGGVLAGLSGSRAAIVTVGLIVCALIVSSGRRGVGAAALLLSGLALSGIPSHELWLGRVAPVQASAGGVDASNGRAALTGQALEIISAHPIVGVGPGNYSTALRDLPALAERTSAYGVLPVHNMPLLAVAESGALILGPLAFVAGCLLIAGVRRRGRWSPLLLAVVPYLLLDLVYWFYPEGLFLVAIAIGFVITGSLERPDEPPGCEAAAVPTQDEDDRGVGPVRAGSFADAVASLGTDMGDAPAELPVSGGVSAVTAGRAAPGPGPR